MPKPKKKALKSWLVTKLRRNSLQWPPKNWAKAEARVELSPALKKDGTPGKRPRVRYKCAHCEELFENKEVVLDHIEPVIDPEVGFVDWNTYIERLFCQSDGFQVLCEGCHDIKTELEDELAGRTNFKKK